jgi:hypothetical protein
MRVGNESLLTLTYACLPELLRRGLEASAPIDPAGDLAFLAARGCLAPVVLV